jgi:hypothetical protein
MAPKANQGGMRMWPSFETASWLFDRANVVLIGAAAIGVVATILVVWMGNVKETYLQKELSDQKERTEGLKRSNLQLEERIAPRRLSAEQQQQLAAAWAPMAGKPVSVVSYSLDLESALLGQQIVAALTLAHAVPTANLSSIMPLGGFSIGIHISGPTMADLNALGLPLQQIGTLDVIGEWPPATGGPPPPATQPLQILIGPKPLK